MQQPAIIFLLLAALFAATAARGQGALVFTVEQCRRVVQHHPADDVAYRAGVDGRGRSVAPADLPGPGAVQTPDTLTIYLDLPLVEFLADGTPPFTAQADVQAGAVDVDIRTGRLRYNGQPLGDPAAHAIAAACARQLKARQRH